MLLVALAAGPATVERQVNDTTATLGGAMADGFVVLDDDLQLSAWSLAGEQSPAPTLSIRSTVKPTAAFDLVGALSKSDSFDDIHIVTQIGFGTVEAHIWGEVSGEAMRSGRDAVISAGGACMIERFGFGAETLHVRRNGIGPVFEGLFTDAEDLLAAKAGPASIAYTSTPFRGLDVLLHAFEGTRERVPEARLEVFSSLEVYQVDAADDPCAELYADCRSAPGVRYRGSVPQPELAPALRGASHLAYPNTFPETSCISVLEALAAGLCVVTSRLGALPETCMGWGELVPPAGEGVEGLLEFSGAFAGALVAELERRAQDPEAFARERMQQVEEVNQNCVWSRRAEEWEEVLSGASA